MAHLVMSTDIDPVNVQAFGNWFSFKPLQIKSMDPKLVDFLALDKRALGFVSLPDVVGDDKDSPEAKEAIEKGIAEGRKNIIEDLERLRYNLEVSLQKDYDMAGIKTSAAQMEGKRHLPVYKKLAQFKTLEQNESQATLDEIKKLKDTLDGNAPAANPSPVNKRS